MTLLDTGGHVVVVGGSIAGLSAVRELRTAGFRGGLTVVDDDAHAPYRRPEVSKSLLTGEPSARTRLDWPIDAAAVHLQPATVEALDLPGRTLSLTTETGRQTLGFDGLVIATGCRSRRLPFGRENPRVHALRGFADAVAFRRVVAAAGRICIVGGGLIGLEVAAVLAAAGREPIVVEAEDMPLGRVLGYEPAALVVEMLRDLGVEFRLSAPVVDIVADEQLRPTVRLATEDVAADAVLVAVGASPNTEWLAGNGLDLVNGVACDRHCGVLGASDVVACGDVASWFNPLLVRRMRVEHWNNAIEQGVFAARRLLGCHDEGGFGGLPYFWSDQADLKLQVLGAIDCHDEATVVTKDDRSLLVEYRAGGALVAVTGVNAGRAVMKRRREILDGLRSWRLSRGDSQ